MSLVGNLTGRAKAEINERELKGSRWVPKRAFSSPLATTRLHARNEPTLMVCLSQKPPARGQTWDGEKGWSKGGKGPALLAASLIGAGFSGEETEGNDYYCTSLFYL